MIRTKGNRYGHVLLRGVSSKPNYYEVSIKACIDWQATARCSRELAQAL